MSHECTDLRADESAISVMLVDDHPIVRDGMRSMLQRTEFEVVAEASGGREALPIALGLFPRIVLLDIRMAGGDGFETLLALKTHLPQTIVVMLTTYDNPTYLARAVAGGAAGYLLKGVKRQDLLSSLRQVASGELLISANDLVHSLRGVSRVAAGARELVIPLTQREQEVLSLLSTGLPNREIASLLFISESTAKTHVEHILGKLCVSDRVQAAVWAARQGLIAISESDSRSDELNTP